MKIALLGFGTVGSAFYELAQGRDDLSVAAVLSRRPRPQLTCTVTADFDEIVRDGEIGLVVEVIGGLEPAYSYVCAALRAGKHVVTANKQLMCAHYAELLALARENGVSLRCTAAAGGGIPWLTSLARITEMDTVTAVEGILNGTTNYMLSSMTSQGANYENVLKEAQALGYAEADPTADVEGYDARRKIVLSANLAFGVDLPEEDVPCVGISSVTAEDISAMAQKGLTFKLIAHAERSGGKLTAFVAPTLFPADAPEAHTNGTGNLVTLYAERIGKQSFSGAGAGGYPTGSNVLYDCIAIARGEAKGYYTNRAIPCRNDLSAASFRWYFRSAKGSSFETATAQEAFARYAEMKQEDPRALLARVKED